MACGGRRPIIPVSWQTAPTLFVIPICFSAEATGSFEALSLAPLALFPVPSFVTAMFWLKAVRRTGS